MAVAKCEFIWGEDKEYGSDGWIPKAMPTFNAMRGLGVAHDVMEHSEITAGTLEEEVMAFGAMIYVRMDGGYFHYKPTMYHRPSEIMPSDLAQFTQERFWNKSKVLADMPWRPRHIDGWEEELVEVVNKTMKALREEFFSAEQMLDFRIANPRFKELLLRWMRKGYWRARKRYRRTASYNLSHTFHEIEQVVDRYSNGAEIGDLLTVSVSVAASGRTDHKVIHTPVWETYEDY